MLEQRGITDKGGTMRLGAYYAVLTTDTKVAAAYGEPVVSERHRHRYEFNSNYRARFEDAGFVCSGTSPDKKLVEFIESADHPFWVGTQAHPEFKSRPDRPHPLFRELHQSRPGTPARRLGAAIEQRRGTPGREVSSSRRVETSARR